jgi:poly(A) polymerase
MFFLDSCSAAAQPAACGPPQPARADWTASFTAGCLDSKGHYAGGSQIMHLVAHKGQLYAATGYWKDSHNFLYGGLNPETGWAQILRLSAPDAPWMVDLELGPRHLRPELLASVTFSQNVDGRVLSIPDTLLIAAAYDAGGRGGVHVFVRDDRKNVWTRTDVVAGDTGRTGEDNSVRAARVYRDRVTGREHLFLSVGIVGLFRAEYDPDRPGRLRWSATPEFVPSGTRILGLAEANGSLFVSDGSRIFRRVDGPAPHYEMVADLNGETDTATDRTQFSAIGGIRGLTAVPAPAGGQQSLLFMWHPGRTSKGCVIRLDRESDGRYTRHREECLARLASQHTGAPVPFILGAYSFFMPVIDPSTGETLHLAGLEAFVPVTAGRELTAHNQRKKQGGMYAGAMYALRDARGDWRVSEVNGRFQPGMPELVSVYTYVLSPFEGQDAGRIYLGGYDCNDYPSTDTAWVYRTDVKNLLTRPAR